MSDQGLFSAELDTSKLGAQQGGSRRKSHHPTSLKEAVVHVLPQLVQASNSYLNMRSHGADTVGVVEKNSDPMQIADSIVDDFMSIAMNPDDVRFPFLAVSSDVFFLAQR